MKKWVGFIAMLVLGVSLLPGPEVHEIIVDSSYYDALKDAAHDFGAASAATESVTVTDLPRPGAVGGGVKMWMTVTQEGRFMEPKPGGWTVGDSLPGSDTLHVTSYAGFNACLVDWYVKFTQADSYTYGWPDTCQYAVAEMQAGFTQALIPNPYYPSDVIGFSYGPASPGDDFTPREYAILHSQFSFPTYNCWPDSIQEIVRYVNYHTYRLQEACAPDFRLGSAATDLNHDGVIHVARLRSTWNGLNCRLSIYEDKTSPNPCGGLYWQTTYAYVPYIFNGDVQPLAISDGIAFSERYRRDPTFRDRVTLNFEDTLKPLANGQYAIFPPLWYPPKGWVFGGWNTYWDVYAGDPEPYYDKSGHYIKIDVMNRDTPGTEDFIVLINDVWPTE